MENEKTSYEYLLEFAEGVIRYAGNGCDDYLADKAREAIQAAKSTRYDELEGLRKAVSVSKFDIAGLLEMREKLIQVLGVEECQIKSCKK